MSYATGTNDYIILKKKKKLPLKQDEEVCVQDIHSHQIAMLTLA